MYLPTACALPIKNRKTSARPAGSSPRHYTTLSRVRKGGAVGAVHLVPAPRPAIQRAMCYTDAMTRDQVKEILDRVLAWPADEQEKVARFVREVEERRDDITDEEWEIIEARAARRDLATDKEVEQVFGRYRSV